MRATYNGGGWTEEDNDFAKQFNLTVGKTYEVRSVCDDRDYTFVDDNGSVMYEYQKYFTAVAPRRISARHIIEGELFIPWGGEHPMVDYNSLSKILYDKGLNGKNIKITIEVFDNQD